MESHIGRDRGWYFPEALVKVHEEGLINESEFVLLGKINSLCHPEKGCWATNRWLAEARGKTPHHISICISKFEKLGLVKIEIKDGHKRVIRVTFNGDEVLRNMHKGVCINAQGGVHKCTGDLSNTNDITKVDMWDAKRRPTTSFASPSFGLNGSSNLKYREASRSLTEKFYWFLSRNRLNIGKADLPQGRSEQSKQKKRKTLSRWQKACNAMLDQLNGDIERFDRVLIWYIDGHWNDKYVTSCEAMTTFCQNFRKIEKQMFRAEDIDPKPTSKYIAEVVEDYED